MKRTPWYPGHIKPVRKGWYEVKLKGILHPYHWTFRWWDGLSWVSGDRCEKVPFAGFPMELLDGDEWRGLKDKP